MLAFLKLFSDWSSSLLLPSLLFWIFIISSCICMLYLHIHVVVRCHASHHIHTIHYLIFTLPLSCEHSYIYMSNCVANCYDMTLERFIVISIFFHLSWLSFRGLRVHSMSHFTYWFGKIYEMLIKSSQSGMLLPMRTRSSNRKLFVPVEWSILMLVLLVLSLPAIRKHWCTHQTLGHVHEQFMLCMEIFYVVHVQKVWMILWRGDDNKWTSTWEIQAPWHYTYIIHYCIYIRYVFSKIIWVLLTQVLIFFLKEAQSFTTIFICMWVAIDNVKLGPCILPSHNDVNPVIWETLVVIKW
jgi:hypothetical protein